MELLILVIVAVCVFLILRVGSDPVSTKKSSPYLLDDGIDDAVVQKPSKPIQEPTARVPTVPKPEKIKEEEILVKEHGDLAEEFNLGLKEEEGRSSFGWREEEQSSSRWDVEVHAKLIAPLTVDETVALVQRFDAVCGRYNNFLEMRQKNLGYDQMAHYQDELKLDEIMKSDSSSYLNQFKDLFSDFSTVYNRIYLFGESIKHELKVKKYEEEWHNGLEKKARGLVDKHYQALKRNYVLSVSYDDYGAIKKDDRSSVLTDFLKSMGLMTEHGSLGTSYDYKAHPVEIGLMDWPQQSELEDYLEKRIESDKREEEKRGFDPGSMPEDGLEFEAWVADSLSSFGWQAKPTQGSGDQGIDVIAEKNGLNVGIQCKRYSGSVGNKAVQEVLAGMTHFRLDRGVVITNAKYTKSAKELAASSNILLLSHFDIPDLEAIFKDE